MSPTAADGLGWIGTDEGGKLKEIGTNHWDSPNTGATNESGFSALPAGSRDHIFGEDSGLHNIAYFWSATESGSSNAIYRSLNYYNPFITRNPGNKRIGSSIRCIKD